MGLFGLWYFAAGLCCLFICAFCFLGCGWASLLFPLATACSFCPQNSPSRTAQSQYPPCKWHVDFFLRSQIFLLWLLQQNIHFIATANIFIVLQKLAGGAPPWTRKSHVQYWAGWAPESRPHGALTHSVYNTVGKTWTWKGKLWGFNQFLFLRCLNVCWSGA